MRKAHILGTLICVSSLIAFLTYRLQINVYNQKYVQFEEKKLEFKAKIVRTKYNVNCKAILELNKTEIERAKTLLADLRNNTDKIGLVDDANFIFPKHMCGMYKSIRYGEKFKREPNRLDSRLPLAYSILIHRNVEELERLLTILYGPSNVYCIHVDAKSTANVKKAVASLADCYDNVFVATQTETVVHSGFSLLKADINCMSDLLYLDSRINEHENLKEKRVVNWKYFINMASTQFPLRTNYEMTRILALYNGSNEVEIFTDMSSLLFRIQYVYKESKEENRIIVTNVTKSAPPHGYEIVKGYGHVVLSRAFAKYAIEDPKARDLLEWGKDTLMPDEWFWATLTYNTKHFSQSGFRDNTNEHVVKTLARFSAWPGEGYDCKGIYRNGMCLFSIEDIPFLISLNHFYVNKFFLEYDPVAYQCMEEWYLERELLMSSQTINMLWFYCDWIKKRSAIADC